MFELSAIEKVDVRGVECYLVRLYYTPPMEDDERDFLKNNRMRYIRPENGSPPCYQYQRQDRNPVENLRNLLINHYGLTDPE